MPRKDRVPPALPELHLFSTQQSSAATHMPSPLTLTLTPISMFSPSTFPATTTSSASATMTGAASSPFSFMSPFQLTCSPVFSPLGPSGGYMAPELPFPQPQAPAAPAATVAASVASDWSTELSQLQDVATPTLTFEEEPSNLPEFTVSEIARITGVAPTIAPSAPVVAAAGKRSTAKATSAKKVQATQVDEVEKKGKDEFLGFCVDGVTPRKRRPKQRVPDHVRNTDAYQRRRKRNTEAARRNRELKRKETATKKKKETAVELENRSLRTEVKTLNSQLEELKQLAAERVASLYPEGVPAHIEAALAKVLGSN
eukprot:m.352110 g.352110  ORF g.352110 m.352110 type:complete len:314 (+) comp16442_c0_seq1:486-1427(+)